MVSLVNFKLVGDELQRHVASGSCDVATGRFDVETPANDKAPTSVRRDTKMQLVAINSKQHQQKSTSINMPNSNNNAPTIGQQVAKSQSEKQPQIMQQQQQPDGDRPPVDEAASRKSGASFTVTWRNLRFAIEPKWHEKLAAGSSRLSRFAGRISHNNSVTDDKIVTNCHNNNNNNNKKPASASSVQPPNSGQIELSAVIGDGTTNGAADGQMGAKQMLSCTNKSNNWQATSDEATATTTTTPIAAEIITNEASSGCTPVTRVVLDHLDGSFRSGELTAILGPSGAGKTTLLDCLTGHRKHGLSGSIRISASPSERHSVDYALTNTNCNVDCNCSCNCKRTTTTTTTTTADHHNQIVHKKNCFNLTKSKSNLIEQQQLQRPIANCGSCCCRNNNNNNDDNRAQPQQQQQQQSGTAADNLKVSIIPQNDHLMGHLTVYETLNYASKMKNCFDRNFDHKMNIKRVAQQLGLISCLGTRVIKLSGGQYKRVSIAQELLSSPDILILDEPTSGLDAMTCFQTVQVLKRLTDESRLGASGDGLQKRIAVILTIHQPNSDVFQQFDNVYVVAQGGKCIFEGPPSGIESAINRIGIHLPNTYYNPATMIVEIAAGKFGWDPVNKLNMMQRKQYDKMWCHMSHNVGLIDHNHNHGHRQHGQRQGDEQNSTGDSAVDCPSTSSSLSSSSSSSSNDECDDDYHRRQQQQATSCKQHNDNDKANDNNNRRQDQQQHSADGKINGLCTCHSVEAAPTSGANADAQTGLINKGFVNEEGDDDEHEMDAIKMNDNMMIEVVVANATGRADTANPHQHNNNNSNNNNNNHLNSHHHHQHHQQQQANESLCNSNTELGDNLASRQRKRRRRIRNRHHFDNRHAITTDGCDKALKQFEADNCVGGGCGCGVGGNCGGGGGDGDDFNGSGSDQHHEKRLKLNSLKADQKFPFWRHTYLHFHRSWLSIIRDPMLCSMQLALHIIVPVMVSLVYGTNVGKPNACPRAGPVDIMAYALEPTDTALQLQEDLRTTLENIGYIFFKLYGIIFAAMTVTVLTFPLDMHVLVKEFRNGWYGLSSYFLGRTLADIPFQLTLPLLAMSLSYYATGQPSSYFQWRFMSITAILILSSLIAQSQGLLFGAILMDRMKAAVFVAPAATTPIILFAGFLVRNQSIPRYLRPLSNLSYLRYAIEACLISRYGFNQCECDPAIFNQTVPELPPIARSMLDYWLSSFKPPSSSSSSTNMFNNDTDSTSGQINGTNPFMETTTTTVSPNDDNHPDLFTKLIDSLAKANSFGRNITSCEQVVPYPMIDYDLKDAQLINCFAILLGMLVFTRLLTFFIVCFKVKRKV